MALQNPASVCTVKYRIDFGFLVETSVAALARSIPKTGSVRYFTPQTSRSLNNPSVLSKTNLSICLNNLALKYYPCYAFSPCKPKQRSGL